jgi:anaerobic ribonucleoside-triphosphate reductase activating protein
MCAQPRIAAGVARTHSLQTSPLDPNDSGITVERHAFGKGIHLHYSLFSSPPGTGHSSTTWRSLRGSRQFPYDMSISCRVCRVESDDAERKELRDVKPTVCSFVVQIMNAPIASPLPQTHPLLHKEDRDDTTVSPRVPSLRIFRRESPVSVLGPGRRAVIWVQGCPFACRNCIVPESWNAEDGEQVSVAELADWVAAQSEIEGLTLSGGEPMAQAGTLTELVRQVRERRDLGVVCYTGYTYERLLAHGAPAQQELLAQIDLLIDGVYLTDRHADLLWRGSANQRLLCLSERYRETVRALTTEADRSAGIEFFMDAQGAVAFAGVPEQPGFREEFGARLAQFGIALQTENEGER